MISSFEFNEDVIFRNIEKQGYTAINDKTVEELAELIQAIQKYRQCIREIPNVDKMVLEKYRDNLHEELADVYIVLENTKLVFNVFNDDIQNVIIEKQERQAKRIAGELPYVD